MAAGRPSLDRRRRQLRRRRWEMRAAAGIGWGAAALLMSWLLASGLFGLPQG